MICFLSFFSSSVSYDTSIVDYTHGGVNFIFWSIATATNEKYRVGAKSIMHSLL